MYRWFLIFAVFNFADSADFVSQSLCGGAVSRYCRPSKARHYGPPHNYYHGNGPTETDTSGQSTIQPLPPANSFEGLAQNLAAAESAVRKYCQNGTYENVMEVFGEDAYTLKYSLRNFKKNNINVKIKHGVIHVTANQVGGSTYEDLRILPSIVNTRLAWWLLGNKYLKIVIPYNVAFRREAVNECGDVNDAIIEVPSMKQNNFLQYRTNDEGEIVTEAETSTSTTTTTTTKTLSVNDAIIFPDSVY